MPRKRSRRATASPYDGEGSIASVEGVIGRFVDNAFDNPAMSAGLFVMALTAMAIVSNALFMQSVRHPEPLFATRPPLVIDRHVPAPPIPPRHDDQTGSIAPPLPRPAPIPAARPAMVDETALMREIQTELAGKGLYLGAIDGLYGALSRSAISEYEKAEGLAVTGKPSAALLDHMKTAVPLPPAPVVASLPPETRVDAAVEAADAVKAELEQLRYQQVQAALNRIGYGPVTVDGTPSDETADAIRRFELDYGLPISGTASEQVIDRLVAIGALPPA